MTVKYFKNDNDGFIAWRDSNPNGYVGNSGDPNLRNEREYFLGHIMLHRASCSFIKGKKNHEKPWTPTGYFKLCSQSDIEIEDWFLKQAITPENWSIRRCKKCA